MSDVSIDAMSLRRRRLLGATIASAVLAAAGGLCALPARAQSVAMAAGARKLALVVGNSAYKIGPLKNPVNDANAVADSLKALGFEVMLREDTTLRDLIESMRQFSVRAQEADVRLIFYAGHGIQVKGRNYLLPVDTEIRAEDEVPAKSADANELLDRLAGIKHGINIVILDACRNNPFSGAEIVGPDGRRLKFRGATPGGLAAMDAPVGTMVAFSTAPGGVALDNPNDRHSLYTKHLVAHIQTTGLPIELLFKQVRLGVARETGRVQVPWESSSLTGDFCFRPAANGGCAQAR